MSKDNTKTPFIISTPTNRGAWYKEKKSTISLINSHVASLKANHVAGHETHGKKAKPSRPDSKGHDTTSNPSTLHVVTLADAHALPQTTSPDCIGISLHGLEDIFAGSVSNVGDYRDQEEGERLDSPPDTTQIIAYVKGLSNTPRSRHAPLLHTVSRPAKTASQIGRRSKSTVVRKFRPKNDASWASRKKTAVFFSDAFSLPSGVGDSLEPFLSLPVEASVRDHQLLHFALTQGRQRLFGTSASPAHCPLLHVVEKGALERSSVFVETQIVMAEHMLCELQGTQSSANFFRRRASAYRSVADLMSKPDAKFDEQMFALMSLLLAEHALGRYDLQILHLRAMHDLVERNGGLRSISQNPKIRSLIEPSFYSGQYIYAKFDSPRNSLAITSATDAIFSSLNQIRTWTLRHQLLQDNSSSQSRAWAAERANNKLMLQSLREYLLAGINQYLRDPMASYHHAAGVFHILFSLCLNMSEFDLDAETATYYLFLLQSYLQKSAGALPGETTASQQADTGDLRGLHPTVTTCLIVRSMRKIQCGQEDEEPTWAHGSAKKRVREKEVSIAEATVNAMKVFGLLSASPRLRISRALYRACMITSELTLGESFSEEALEDLELELRQLHT